VIDGSTRISPSQSAIRGSIVTSGADEAPPPPIVPEPSAPAPDPARRLPSPATPEDAVRPTSCLRGFGRAAADDSGAGPPAAARDGNAAPELEAFAAPAALCVGAVLAADARSGVGLKIGTRSVSGPPAFASSSPSERRPDAFAASAACREESRSLSLAAARSGTGGDPALAPVPRGGAREAAAVRGAPPEPPFVAAEGKPPIGASGVLEPAPKRAYAESTAVTNGRHALRHSKAAARG